MLEKRVFFQKYMNSAYSHNIPYEKIGDEVVPLDVPFDIPDSWEWVRLGQIVYNRGQCTPQEYFCYIDIGSINNKMQCLNSDETILSAEKAPSRARKLVEIGDILYSTVRPYLHNMCIIDRTFSKMPIASTGFADMTCHKMASLLIYERRQILHYETQPGRFLNTNRKQLPCYFIQVLSTEILDA